MARRVGWYFIFIGIVLLAVAFVLAMGQQPSGRALIWGLGSVLGGVWVVLRSGSAARVAPAAPPSEAKAKQGPKPPAARRHEGGQSPPPAGAARESKPAASKPAPKPNGLSALFQPRMKSRKP